jgi:spore coat polysaccharide biosynthesis protein SpsF (cytidylyltransferase family)
MAQSKPVDPAVSMDDPRAVFKTPQAVLESALSTDEKHAILTSWKEDEAALVRAASEGGMVGGENDILPRVEKALDQIESERS